MGRTILITPYRNADCSSLNSTTWAATVVGTETAAIQRLLIESTVDQDLEFGFDSGTGSTVSFYWLGVPHTAIIDFAAGLLTTTLYVRRQGTTPTANTKLLISALG